MGSAIRTASAGVAFAAALWLLPSYALAQEGDAPGEMIGNEPPVAAKLPTAEEQINTRKETITSHIRAMFSSPTIEALRESASLLEQAAAENNLSDARNEVDEIIADLQSFGDHIRPDSAVERATLSLDAYVRSVAETIKARPNLTPAFVSSRSQLLDQLSADLAAQRDTIAGFHTTVGTLLVSFATLRDAISLDMIIGRIDTAGTQLETSASDLLDFLGTLDAYVRTLDEPLMMSVGGPVGD